MSRPTKRSRRTQGFHIDNLDHGDNVDYEDIQLREGRLNRSGTNTVREAPSVQVPIEDGSGAWMNLQSWSAIDDTDLALDPSDGRMYEQAVEQDVMDETGADGIQVEKKRYIRSKVSVSLIVTQFRCCTEAL